MISNITKVLSNLGWGSGFRIPVANEENKALEQLLEKRQREGLELKNQLEDENRRVESLKENILRVNREMQITQNLSQVKRSSIASEENTVSNVERSKSHMEQEIKRMRKERKELQERNIVTKHEVTQRKELVEDLIKLVQWDNEALTQYKSSINEKETHIDCIQKYNDIDKRMIMELEHKVVKVQEETNKLKEKLQMAGAETNSLQVELKRESERFRLSNEERAEAIGLWNQAVEILRRRGNEMDIISKELEDLSNKKTELEKNLSSFKSMHENESNERILKEREASERENKLQQTGGQILKEKNSAASLRDDALAFKMQLKRGAEEVKIIESNIKNKEIGMKDCELKIERLTKEVDKLKMKAKDMEEMKGNYEEECQSFEGILYNEEMKQLGIERETEKLRKFLLKRTKELSYLKDEVTNLDIKINGIDSVIKSLKEKEKFGDLELQKKVETVKNCEMKLILAERKLSKLKAPKKNSEEYEVAQINAARLKKKLEKCKRNSNFLKRTVTTLNEICERIEMDIKTIGDNHNVLKAERDVVLNIANRFEVDIARERKSMHELLVETNLMKLMLRRIQDKEKSEKGMLFSLEKEKLLIEKLTKERKLEIESHVALVQAKKKILNDTRNKLTIQLTELEREVDLKKKKYDVIVNSIQTGGVDIQSEDVNEIFHLLKIAQEKEILKREGSKWDKRVKEAEGEIMALQNTLSLMVSSNDSFKDSLAPIHTQSYEGKTIKDMEEEEKSAIARKLQAKKMQRELKKKMEKKKGEILEFGKMVKKCEVDLADRNYELNALSLEIENQKGKIERANLATSRLLRTIGEQPEAEKKLIEMDLKLRCTKEKYEFTIKNLEKMLYVHSEMREPAIEFLSQSNLSSLVTRLNSGSRSRSSSRASTPSNSNIPEKLEKRKSLER